MEAEVIEIDVVAGGIVVLMKIGRLGFDGAGIAPAVAFDMPVSKSEGGSAIMIDAGPIEKIFRAGSAHFHAEVRPADALIIDVDEGEKLRRARRDNLLHFGVNAILVFVAETLIPRPHPCGVPPNPGIKFVAAEFRPEFTIDVYAARIAGTKVKRVFPHVRGEKRVTLVGDESGIGIVLRIIKSALHPKFLGGAAAGGRFAVEDKPVVVVSGVKLPDQINLLFVADTLGELRLLFRGAERRQQQGGQYRDDRYDNEEFDECKCARRDAPMRTRRSGQSR